MEKINYYSLGDVSGILDVPAYTIVYLLSTRQVPEPARIGGRRVFTMREIQRIADKLELELMQKIQGTDDK